MLTCIGEAAVRLLRWLNLPARAAAQQQGNVGPGPYCFHMAYWLIGGQEAPARITAELTTALCCCLLYCLPDHKIARSLCCWSVLVTVLKTTTQKCYTRSYCHGSRHAGRLQCLQTLLLADAIISWLSWLAAMAQGTMAGGSGCKKCHQLMLSAAGCVVV